MLRALAALPRELELELVIAGRGPLEQEVRQAAESDPRIDFVGYVTGVEKDALLASADCLLIPSLWYENAPVAVIEAAAYQLVVVGSRIGGLPELVDEGRTGFLFEPGDAYGLAAVMRRLIDGTATLPELATASSTLAEQHSVARMVDAYLDCYASVLESCRDPVDKPRRRSLEIEHAS